MANSTRGEGWNARNEAKVPSNGIAGETHRGDPAGNTAGTSSQRYEAERLPSHRRSYYRSAVDRASQFGADEDRIFRSDDPPYRSAYSRNVPQRRSFDGTFDPDGRYGGGLESFDRSMAGRRVERALPFGGEGYSRRQSRWQREPAIAYEVMTKGPKTLSAEGTLRDAARIMRDENCGIVPVVDAGERLLGVITDRDIVVRGVAEDRPLSQLRVSDFMTDEVDCVTSDEPLTSVIDLMGERQVRRIPVVDRQDRLVGIIAMADIAKRADYDDNLQEALERISSRRSFWNQLFG